MWKSIIRAWAGDPEERVMILHLPSEMFNGLDTLAFVTNERRKAMGSSQGGVHHWGLVTREELIEDAIAEYLRQHLQVSTPKTRPRLIEGTGRTQQRGLL